MEDAVKEIMDYLKSKIDELNEAGYDVYSIGGDVYDGSWYSDNTVNVFFREGREWFRFRREDGGEITKEIIERSGN